MRIGVFGCGNMGRALVLGMKAQNPECDFFLFTPSQTKAIELARSVNGTHVVNSADMPKDLDWYFIAFKPQSLPDFHFAFSSEAKVLSVLAGVKVEKLKAQFNVKKIARLMPNTPSAIGLGANLLYSSPLLNPEDLQKLKSLLTAIGSLYMMDSELDLDLTTPFSGSGPALLFEMARIFEEELTALTDGRVPAKEIITQLFLGSAELMKSQSSFEDLRNQVTSKKGVTYEALEVLKEKNLQEIFQKAFKAAYNRTIELSK